MNIPQKGEIWIPKDQNPYEPNEYKIISTKNGWIEYACRPFWLSYLFGFSYTKIKYFTDSNVKKD